MLITTPSIKIKAVKALGGKNVTVKLHGDRFDDANVDFDRLRYVSERYQVGQQTEAILAVTIPEEPGSLMALHDVLNEHDITEFNYRGCADTPASVFVGIQVPGGTKGAPPADPNPARVPWRVAWAVECFVLPLPKPRRILCPCVRRPPNDPRQCAPPCRLSPRARLSLSSAKPTTPPTGCFAITLSMVMEVTLSH